MSDEFLQDNDAISDNTVTTRQCQGSIKYHVFVKALKLLRQLIQSNPLT